MNKLWTCFVSVTGVLTDDQQPGVRFAVFSLFDKPRFLDLNLAHEIL